MKARFLAMAVFGFALTVSPVVSAQTMGDGMTKGGQMEMKGAAPGQMQMMQEMGQMMEMMQTMMRQMQNMAQDPKAKGEMGEMMKRMDHMREQHQTMMREQGMMPEGKPK
ncbi:MAG: hypothetical protein ACOYXU_03525 [Nitrospirota bacterium]